MNAPVKPPIRREAMRIAGRKVETDRTIEVLNPHGRGRRHRAGGAVPTTSPV